MSVSIGITAMAMLAMVSVAQAQPPMPSHYAWSDGVNSAKLWLHKRGRSVAILEYKTCAGQVVGVAKRKGRAVTVTSDACILNITFSKDYARAYVKENKCSEMHGANCYFDGTLTKQ